VARGSNVHAWALEIDHWIDVEVPEEVVNRLTVIALEAMRSLIEKTPVDTGRAKGNWQLTLGIPAVGEVDVIDDSPQGTVPSGADMQVLSMMPHWRMPEFIWFHNGVGYIEFLENGTEKMAAVHMLERTVDHLQRWLGI
jgi:hypothetical protein